MKKWTVNKEENQESVYFWQPNVENVAKGSNQCHMLQGTGDH